MQVYFLSLNKIITVLHGLTTLVFLNQILWQNSYAVTFIRVSSVGEYLYVWWLRCICMISTRVSVIMLRSCASTYMQLSVTARAVVGRREEHPACKKLGVRLLVVTIWSFARLIAPVYTTTSVILSSNKIQNGDVLVSTNPDPSGKWPLKRRESRPLSVAQWSLSSDNYTC